MITVYKRGRVFGEKHRTQKCKCAVTVTDMQKHRLIETRKGHKEMKIVMLAQCGYRF